MAVHSFPTEAVMEAAGTPLRKHCLVEIVEKSAYLYERIGPEFVPVSQDKDEISTVQARLKRWCEQVSYGDEELWQRRLSWDGLDLESARAIAGGVQLRNPEQLPAWADYLEGAISTAEQFRGKSAEEVEKAVPRLHWAKPIAFQHLLAPFVLHAMGRLQEKVGVAWTLLTDEARSNLERHLFQIYASVSERTLETEFAVWRSVPDPDFMFSSDVQSKDRVFYDSFLRKISSQDWMGLLLEYPVLGRLLGQSTESWVEFVSEMLLRLCEDLPEMATFNRGNYPGRIAEIKTDLSDVHDGGKAVIRVAFESGLIVFYKPRNICVEKVFNDLLEWLNEHGAPLPFKTYQVLVRGDYGWVEEVLHRCCTTESEVRRYYHRGGALLAVLYLLEANDCNCQNLISDGEYPMLIDLETILQHWPKPSLSSPWGGVDEASRIIYYNSVFRIGLLPRWENVSAGGKIDMSGFGSSEGGRGFCKRKVWDNINTDDMALRWEEVAIVPEGNTVYWRDQQVKAADYLDEIITGFTEMYRLVMEHRQLLGASGGPLEAMNGLHVRFLARNTRVYALILEHCRLPQNLRDGMDASICVDKLARQFWMTGEKPSNWPVFFAEQAALLQGDIPHFTAMTNCDAFEAEGDKQVPQFFAGTSYDLLKTRLVELSEDDLDLQICYIRCSFAAPEINSCPVNVADESPVIREDSSQIFLAQALSIADRIQEKAIYGKDGTTSWITRTYHMDSQFWRIQPMSLYLYDGISGIVLFLAALENVTGETGFRELIAAVLKVFERLFSQNLRYAPILDNLGAGLGAPSIVYSLARVGLFLEDEQPLDTACRLAGLLSEDHIARDRRLDVLGGTAGFLLVLRTLYRIVPKPWILERAVRCGEHLLKSRRTTQSGLRSWPTILGKFLAGFAHGAAGVIYALTQLYEMTGDRRFREAAVEGQAYENTLFVAREKNWLNLLTEKKDGKHSFWNSWCQGAPGVGLARLGSLTCLDPTSALADLEAALDTTARQPQHHLDTVCCGNLGRVELLLEFSSKMGKHAYRQRALEMLDSVVGRAQKAGSYAAGLKDGIFIPSFHQGMAGIGYQLLRAAKPGRLPSVLSWE